MLPFGRFFQKIFLRDNLCYWLDLRLGELYCICSHMNFTKINISEMGTAPSSKKQAYWHSVNISKAKLLGGMQAENQSGDKIKHFT